MRISKIFGGKGKGEEESRELSVEDLITLERYEDAESVLKRRIKLSPQDLYSHLKLAEVHLAQKNLAKALDEYLLVADAYASDGFFDKGIALLSKATRLAPGDEQLQRKIEKLRRLKSLEHRRRLAIEGLQSNQSTGALNVGDSALAVQLLWNKIAKSHLVERLQGEQLKRLFSAMELIKVQRGEVLADDGSRESVMYLIVDGVVEAIWDHQDKETNLRDFTTGAIIGDSALVERKPWPARYRVSAHGTVFRLDRDGLPRAMTGDDDPRRFLEVLCQQNSDRQVREARQKLERS